jgi:hypothetical protein
MYKRLSLVVAGLLLFAAPTAWAYVEAPYSLGQVCNESTTIVLVEVTRVDKDKGLIIYKKLQDLKGKHPTDTIKHNIGKRGYHEREWKNVMAWAEVGKKAVVFHNGSASETCIEKYWYQTYPEGEWWGMSHAEPFLSRTYFGDPEKLADHVTAMLDGKEVVVPCLADGNKDQLHNRQGKVQRMKASLKRGNYDVKRDFVAFGEGDGSDDVVAETKTITLLQASSPDWKYLPAKGVTDAVGDKWRAADFDDSKWKTGKAPVGYGEDEIAKRKGTTVAEQGVPFVFRRVIDIPSDLLSAKGVTFTFKVASDDSADLYVNGELVDHDPELDHEFAYWNREAEAPAKILKAGKNVIAVYVRNHQGSSDIYLDVEVAAQVPLPPAPKKPKPDKPDPTGTKPNDPPKEEEKPGTITVDKKARSVTIDCAVAARKLPNLNEIYPIEVVACYPHPKGQKAHETVVTFSGIKPSAVHKALEELGLKAGKPAVGEEGKGEGPELKIFLEVPGADGKTSRLPIENFLMDRKTEKPLPPLTWHFTGSVMKQPDPEKDEKVYAADLTGTLITVFPVTDETLIQSNLTLKDEPVLKLEIPKGTLPKEGAPLKMVIVAK